jgi:hypothetical protein
MVNCWHTPSVGHGYEPVALFSTPESANACAARFNAAAGIEPVDTHTQRGEYDVDEWVVDDPELAAS